MNVDISCDGAPPDRVEPLFLLVSAMRMFK